MKQKFLVLAIFPVVVDTALQFNETGNKTERMLMMTSHEGIYDTPNEAQDRVNELVAEESQNADCMYFEVRPVFVKNPALLIKK